MSDASNADVIIVGSGVAGALIAHQLAKAGKSVLILEAGPRIERWRIVENFRNSPAKDDFMTPYPSTPHAPHPEYSPENNYLIFKGPQKNTIPNIFAPWAAPPGIGRQPPGVFYPMISACSRSMA